MKTLILVIQYFALMGALVSFQCGIVWLGIVLVGITIGCAVYQVREAAKEEERENTNQDSDV
jgi:uncharacterized membrane protein YdbT with pleckstrin-like domain